MGNNSKPNNGSGGSGGSEEPTENTQHFTDEQWNSVSTPEEIAELIGWEVKVTRNKSGKITSVHFHDPEHDMDVEFDSLTSKNAKHLYDMDNEGKPAPDDDLTDLAKSAGLEFERRNFRDVVRTVQELSDDQKYATPLIQFKNDILSARAYGSHIYMNENSMGHMVIIYGVAFFKNTPKNGHSLERTLEHETNHALDYMSTNYKNSSPLSGSGLSSKKKFVDEITKIGNGSKSITENVEHYDPMEDDFEMRFRTESFADAKSIVNMRNKGKGSEYVVTGDGKSITVDDWCNKYSTLADIVEGMTVAPEDYGVNKGCNYPLHSLFRL